MQLEDLERERREKPNRRLVLSITPTLERLLFEVAGSRDRSKSHVTRAALRRFFRFTIKKRGST